LDGIRSQCLIAISIRFVPLQSGENRHEDEGCTSNRDAQRTRVYFKLLEEGDERDNYHNQSQRI
jgi:hypothetical protein